MPGSFDQSVAGPALEFLSGSVVFYWILVICFEQKLFDIGAYRNRNNNNQPESFQAYNKDIDSDVIDEKKRVQTMSAEDLKIKVANVNKRFGDTVAVNDISFGLQYGECFALLGVSGAGKTTLFKCLTGDIYPSRGEVMVSGFDITTSSGFQNARKTIGYCPQFDAIFTGLTVLEHLQIYANLKGISAGLKDRIIQTQINDMDLRDYVDIQA